MKRRLSILLSGMVLFLGALICLILIFLFSETGGMLVSYLTAATILIILAAIVLFYFGVYMRLSRVNKKLGSISRGETISFPNTNNTDEIDKLETNLSVHQERLKYLAGVAEDLSEGKTGGEFTLISERDEFGKAMLKLKESIILSEKETQKRRAMDDQQNWAAQGVAKFGELLRNIDQKTAQVASDFIKELVKYLDMEVGGLFLMKDDPESPRLILAGAYAFDREKQVNKSFDIGEGLVGRCALEKETILITDVPKDYIRIRSGMGEDNPSTLLLVPILLDNKVLGIIEVASFKEVARYKIDFLESLGISIAPSLTKVQE